MPGPPFRRFATGMARLDAGNDAFLFEEFGHRFQRGNLAIVPETQIAMGSPAPVLNGRGFGIDKSGPAHGKAPEVHQVPVIRLPIDRAVLGSSERPQSDF